MIMLSVIPAGNQEINCSCQWREKIRGHCYTLCDAVDEVVLAVSASLWRVGPLARRQVEQFDALDPWNGRRSAPAVILDEYAPSRDDFEYCQQFVIEVVSRVAEVNSALEPPPWLWKT
jgi:hypothetical protein